MSFPRSEAADSNGVNRRYQILSASRAAQQQVNAEGTASRTGERCLDGWMTVGASPLRHCMGRNPISAAMN